MYATDDFHQLKLRFLDPVQHDYEVIRPIVLFAKPVAERGRETDTPEAPLGACRAHVGGRESPRFVEQGMLGLVDKRTSQAGPKVRVYPEPIAR